MIRLGYACINTRLPSAASTCRLKNASAERITELASANLCALQKILKWNVAHEIALFRITSDVIPFGSHASNRTPWRLLLKDPLDQIGRFIRAQRLRVSMHPGQFTVLNSPRPAVVKASIAELEYHTEFLDALGLDSSHKIVVHLGGVYDDKQTSLKRLITVGQSLDRRIKARLVLENDERCYSIADALSAGREIGTPVVFDVFHHRWNPAFKDKSLRAIIELSSATWHRDDGRVKIHYSNQWPGSPPGTHSKTINLHKFRSFYAEIHDLEIDVMLEVKDKERSVLRLQRELAINAVR